jgi:hypothetical protein
MNTACLLQKWVSENELKDTQMAKVPQSGLTGACCTKEAILRELKIKCSAETTKNFKKLYLQISNITHIKNNTYCHYKLICFKYCHSVPMPLTLILIGLEFS